MKDKRNCGMNYPVYPNPMFIPPNYPHYNNIGISPNTYEQQLNGLQEQINLLDQRVNRLEKLNSTNSNYNNKYNDSNYYMV